MKKALKIVCIVLAVLIVNIIVLPFAFKGKIEQIVVEQINKTINAEVTYKDYSLSLFRSFPNFKASFDDIAIIGNDDFEGDTLISIGSLSANINIKSVFGNNGILLEAINLDQSTINMLVNSEGKANWDIMKEDTSSEQASIETDSATEEEGSSIKFRLQKIEINDFNFIYDDRQSNYQFLMKEISGAMDGDFEGMIAKLNITAAANKVSYIYENSAYLENRKIEIETNLIANFDTFDFQFDAENSHLNQIPLSIQGGFAMPTDTMDFDIHIDAPELSVQQLLELIPSAYSEYTKDLQASGDIQLNGSLVGKMIDEIYPAINFNLSVQNGVIKHPQLPEEVRIETLNVSANKEEGGLDLFEIGIPKFNLSLANNPISMHANFSSLMTDPLLDISLDGIVDFEAITKIIPIDSMTIKGVLNANAGINGRYSALENNQFDQFNSTGTMQLSNFNLVNSTFPDGVSISNAKLTLNDQAIAIEGLKGEMGKSDVSLEGKIDNVISWFMDKGELRGQFKMASNLLDLNEFMTDNEAAPSDSTTNSTSTTAQTSTSTSDFELPKAMNLTFNASVKKILYDQMTISDFKGGILLRNQMLTLTGLNMGLLDGEVAMSGKVVADGLQNPHVDLTLVIQNLNLPTAYKQLSLVRHFMPFAANSEGRMSTSLNLKSEISDSLKMALGKVNASGNLSMRGLKLLNVKNINNMESLIQSSKLEKLTVKDFSAGYVITDGNIELKPFSTEIAAQPISVKGTLKLDGTIDFRLDGKVETAILSDNLQKIVKSIPGSNTISKIDIGLDLVGDVKKPQIKFDEKLIKTQVSNQLKTITSKDIEDAAKKLLQKFSK